MYSKQQTQEAYKKLPLAIQDFVMSGETLSILDSVLSELKISEESKIKIDGEIFAVMLKLQTLDQALINIKSQSALSEDLIQKLENRLSKEIFEPIQKLKQEENKSEKTEEIGEKGEEGVKGEIPAPVSPAGNIPEITPDIHPLSVDEPTDVAHRVEPPANLPGQEEQAPVESSKQYVVRKEEVGAQSNEQKQTEPLDNSYPKGQDPYREPIE